MNPRSFAILGVLFFVAWTPIATAAEKYVLNEDVEVRYFDKWVRGVVVEITKKGEPVVLYLVNGSERRERTAFENIRHMYESGAIQRGRLWTDESGKFHVKAALLNISGGQVELRTDDLKTIKLPIEKLSSRDQTMIKQFKAKMGVAALAVPERLKISKFDSENPLAIESDSKPGHFRRANDDEIKIELKMSPDPMRQSLRLKEGGVPFPVEDIFVGIGSMFALGGADSWMLASIEPADSKPTQLIWASVTKGEVRQAQLLPPGEMLMDYHTGSRQLVTLNRRSNSVTNSESAVLSVWSTDPTKEEAKGVIAWDMVPDKISPFLEPWVRFVSESKLLCRLDRKRLGVWDFVEKKLIWTMEQNSFHYVEPVLSPNGKFLYVPEDDGLRILDPSTGVTLSKPPIPECVSVAVHADGKKIAVAGRNRIYLIDITGETSTQLVKADSVGVFEKTMDWIGDEFLCLQDRSGFTLFSIKLELPIWSYDVDGQAFSHRMTLRGGRRHSVIDNHLVYAARFQESGKHGLVLGAVSLPGKREMEAMAKVDRTSYIGIQKGSKVRVEVNAIDHASEIRALLEKQVVASGWILDPTSQHVLKGEYRRGKTETIEYQLRGTRNGTSMIASAQVTPYVSRLGLLVDGQEAWSIITIAAPPSQVRFSESTTLQAEVDKYIQPNWESFGTFQVPSTVVDPKKKRGVGSSVAGLKGLVEKK